MIHVSYGLHDQDGHYTKFVGTSMTSIFENTREEVTVHILHDPTLTPDNRDKLNYVAGKYNQRIKFYNVAQLAPERLKFLSEKLPQIFKGRFSIGTFYRLLMTEIMPKNGINRVIYLDADILVNLDIADLWFTNIGDRPLGAVPELDATSGHMVEHKHIIETGVVAKENYFNAGVLLLNFDVLNKTVADIFTDGVNFLVNNPKCECFDQDILNNYFSTNYHKLPGKFDYFVQADRTFMKTNTLHSYIYHYAGREINFDMKNVYSKFFFENFMRTPWFDTEFIGKMYDYLQRMNLQMKVSFQQLSSLLARRQRAFYVEPQVLDAMKKYFGILPTEEVINSKEAGAFEKLLKSMRASQGKKVYFILVTNIHPVHDRLTAEGFKYGSDYLNGRGFLAESQGGLPMNSYDFIKAM